MKKVVLIVLLLVGCAGAPPQQDTYAVSDEIINRVNPLFFKISDCMRPPLWVLRIYDSDEIFAWTDEYEDRSRVNFTRGMLRYDNDTITFIFAHELSHIKLNHLKQQKDTSNAVTGAMLVVNFIVPGAGLLNHAINPVVVNQYSKSMELEADKLASDTCARCLGIPPERQIAIMKSTLTVEAGGFWSTHPSADDRIRNIAPAP